MVLTPSFTVSQPNRPDGYGEKTTPFNFIDTSVPTKLLLHLDGADGSTTIIDECGKAMSVAGSAQLSIAEQKFGATSLVTDGNADYVYNTVPSLDFAWGTSAFTVDFWVRVRSFTPNGPTLFSHGGSNADGTVYIDDASHCLKYYAQGLRITSSTPMVVDTWYHIALIGNGGLSGLRNIKLYMDGQQVGSTYTVNYNFTSTTIAFGANQSSFSSCLDGYIDDARISTAELWTGNFTRPIAPAPAPNPVLTWNWERKRSDIPADPWVSFSTAQYPIGITFPNIGDWDIRLSVTTSIESASHTESRFVHIWFPFTKTTIQADCQDTFMDVAVPTTNYSTANPVLGNVGTRRMLFKIDLSSLPLGFKTTTVTWNHWSCKQTSYSPGGEMYPRIGRVLKNVVINQATWNEYATGSAWGAGGCTDVTDFTDDYACGSYWEGGGAGALTQKNFDISTFCLQWEFGIPNYGWVLYGTAGWDAFGVVSAEDATRFPKFIYNFLLPPVVAVPDFTVNRTTGIRANPCFDFTDTTDTTIYAEDSWLWEYRKLGSLSWVSFSTAQNPTGVSFADRGEYDIRLTVTNEAGSGTETKLNYIHIWNLAPTPLILADIADTTLNGSDPTVNYGHDTTIQVHEYGPLRTLIKFTPPGVPIWTATVFWYLDAYGSWGGHSSAIYICLRDWAEYQATWNEYSTGNSWATAGGLGIGDFTTYGAVGVPTCGVPNWTSFDCTAMTLAWEDGSYPNHGFLAVIYGGYVTIARSRETANPAFAPYMSVQYLTVPSAPVVDFSATPLTGSLIDTLTFTDLSVLNGDLVDCTWSWYYRETGGSTWVLFSSVQNPTLVTPFPAPGNYDIKLAVSNDYGASDETKLAYIFIWGRSDTYIDSDNPTTNYGALPTFVIGNDTTTTGLHRGLIKFDLVTVPDNAYIFSAKAYLYYDGTGQSNSLPLPIYTCLKSWLEWTATWNFDWYSPGCSQSSVDYRTPSLDVKTISFGTPAWYDWNVTTQVQRWIWGLDGGKFGQQGFILANYSPTSFNGNLKSFASYTNPNSGIRPYLDVVYGVPPTIPTITTIGAYTKGISNTIYWSDESGTGAVEYYPQMAENSDFDAGVRNLGGLQRVEISKVDTVNTVLTFYCVRSVVGVYDNPNQTGTNYYTGGSFLRNTITLGTPVSTTENIVYVYYVSNGWVPTRTLATFGGLTHGLKYYYRVRARDVALAETNWSGYVSSTQDDIIETNQLLLPQGGNVWNSGFTQTLQWKASDSYSGLTTNANIYLSHDSGITWNLLATAPNLNLVSQESQTSVTRRQVFTNYQVQDVTGVWLATDPLTLGATTFVGSGLNDATVGGTYSNSVTRNYVVKIDSVGATDTFSWSDSGGTTWNATNVAITGGTQSLNYGITITFGSITAHTALNYWMFTAGHVGKNYYTLGSFDRKEITLGDSLPTDTTAVLIQYTTFGIYDWLVPNNIDGNTKRIRVEVEDAVGNVSTDDSLVDFSVLTIANRLHPSVFDVSP